MTYGSVFFVLGLFFFALVTFAYWNWPRDDEGNLMDPEEVKELLSKFEHEDMTSVAVDKVILVFVFIILLVMAIGKSAHSDSYHDNFRD